MLVWKGVFIRFVMVYYFYYLFPEVIIFNAFVIKRRDEWNDYCWKGNLRNNYECPSPAFTHFWWRLTINCNATIYNVNDKQFEGYYSRLLTHLHIHPANTMSTDEWIKILTPNIHIIPIISFLSFIFVLPFNETLVKLT